MSAQHKDPLHRWAIHEDVCWSTRKTTVPVPDGNALPGGFVANNATRTTGRFVTKLTNDSTFYSISSAENGPNWFTFDATPTSVGATPSLNGDRDR
jgi:hypothetical protein